jgi:hypothetical protein
MLTASVVAVKTVCVGKRQGLLMRADLRMPHLVFTAMALA